VERKKRNGRSKGKKSSTSCRHGYEKTVSTKARESTRKENPRRLSNERERTGLSWKTYCRKRRTSALNKKPERGGANINQYVLNRDTQEKGAEYKQREMEGRISRSKALALGFSDTSAIADQWRRKEKSCQGWGKDQKPFSGKGKKTWSR